MRINHVLQILTKHLDGYDQLTGKVIIANVGENTTLTEHVLLTLVKVSEENTLRNGRYAKLNQNFKTVYKNRPIFTNLYVLFSCRNDTSYDTALNMLSQVVEFFQGKNVFTHLDGETDKLKTEKFKLIVELQDLSFEQTNYIWSFLGGKQLPSVLYKIRMIPLEAIDKINGKGEPILEINIDGNANY